MTPPFFRRELPSPCRRLVIKVGSAALAHVEHGADTEKIDQLARECSTLAQVGTEIILVSSGAIAIGRRHLKPGPVVTSDFLQACSAIGQPLLMRAYSEAFQKHARHCAQVLLTHEDILHRQRRLNLKNMMNRLLAAGVTPILNENDSVSYAEITVGDNDQLAAMVTDMMGADALLLLSTPDGLFDRDPEAEGATHYPLVAFDEKFAGLQLAGKSLTGRGGMKTKLEAVRKLTPLGIPVMLGSFRHSSPVLHALGGGGTFFAAGPSTALDQRQRWLLTSVKAGAAIRVDAGAGIALKQRNSLLPSGVRHVDGRFRRGDCVRVVCGPEILGSGLVEYSSAELEKIKGCRSHAISGILGYCPAKVVLHRDNFALYEQAHT